MFFFNQGTLHLFIILMPPPERDFIARDPSKPPKSIPQIPLQNSNMGFFYPFFKLFSIPELSQNQQCEKAPQQQFFQQFLPIIFQQELIWLRYIHTQWFCSLIEASSQIMLLKQQMRLFTKNKKSLYPCSKRLLAWICLRRITQGAPKNGILQF